MREWKDFYIYNDGTTLTASSPAIKATHSQEMLCGNDGYKRAFAEGKLMIIDMADDDEILARVVLGHSSADEQAYWSGRTRGIIDCSDGKFSVQSSFNNFKDNEYNEDAQEFIYPVPAAVYQVDCYVYMPSSTAIFLHDDSRDLMVAKWWRESHKNEDYPDWIIYEACDNYDADTEEHYKSYWEDRTADIDTDDLSKYVDWVFHLTPLEGEGVYSDSEDTGFMKWERRVLDKAPTGLATELNPYACDDVEEDDD